jgi:HAD superfamily hydrolase (TIGR01549 family)
MSEPSFEERARLSAHGVRTFLNIGRRWKLSEEEMSQLLQCSLGQLREWAAIARGYRPLVLEASTLLRISAILGIYADLRQAVTLADDELIWLFRPLEFAPFDGSAPISVLSGSFEDQLAVRRYLGGVVDGHVAPDTIDPTLRPYNNDDLVGAVTPDGIQAICFDAFGTLVEITDKRRPFRTLLGYAPSGDAATRALTHPIGLRELSREFAISIGEERLAELESDLEAECASTRLRPGMDLAWTALRRARLKIAICSNLADPYEQALLACLPGIPDALALSFRAGLMKPQTEIYQAVFAQLALLPEQILFVGDSLEADVLGPRSAGAFAMHITEFETSLARQASPHAPRQIADLFERIAAAQRG